MRVASLYILTKLGKPAELETKSGSITTIALPAELVVMVVENTLENSPVFVPESDGIRQDTSSGASTDKMA